MKRTKRGALANEAKNDETHPFAHCREQKPSTGARTKYLPYRGVDEMIYKSDPCDCFLPRETVEDMSRSSGSSRNLGGGGGGRDRGAERKFEDVYRIYHEVREAGVMMKGL